MIDSVVLHRAIYLLHRLPARIAEEPAFPSAITDITTDIGRQPLTAECPGFRKPNNSSERSAQRLCLNRAATSLAMAAGASSGMAKTELTLISQST